MKPLTAISKFVLTRLEAEPVRERVKLYRALAEIVGTPKQHRELRALADELEGIERRHGELALDFKSACGGQAPVRQAQGRRSGGRAEA